MSKYLIPSLLSLFIVASSAHATTESCDAVLAPTVLQTSRDYRLMQAYMYVNAAYEYDRLNKMSSDARSADASYKAFSAAYNESHSNQEFQEQIRAKLTQENFAMSESDSRAYYRKGPSDAQVAEWGKCIAEVRGRGGLLLIARNATDEGFSLVATWVLQVGVGQGTLELDLDGGTIGNKPKISEKFQGSGGKVYIVKKTGAGKSVRVIGNIAGHPDAILVSKAPTVTRRTVTKQCSENEACPSGAKVVACLSTGERPDVPANVWLQGPQSSAFRAGADGMTTSIEFGHWENQQCGLSGDGWHAKVGSCGTGVGTGWHRCAVVKVEMEVTEVAD